MSRRRLRFRVALLLAVAHLVSACAGGRAYVASPGPRFGGVAPDAASPLPVDASSLRVVTYNIEEGREWRSALSALRADTAMAVADVILLQEMEEEGVAAMARALHMYWVYYPAMARGGEARNWGNAVLSRWPLLDDRKLVLPHPGIFVRSRRVAAVATIAAPMGPVRVYSVHLGTPINTFWPHRREQFETVLDDAAGHPRVVIGGDFNGTGLLALALERGYSWPTEEGPRTLWIGRWDHILVKGMPAPPRNTGTGSPPDGISDHRPVWATVTRNPPPASEPVGHTPLPHPEKP